MTLVRLKPAAPQSRVKHSATEPLRSLNTLYHDTKVMHKVTKKLIRMQTVYILLLMGTLTYLPEFRITGLTFRYFLATGDLSSIDKRIIDGLGLIRLFF